MKRHWWETIDDERWEIDQKAGVVRDLVGDGGEYPLDPAEALERARETGREWAGNLDPEEIENGDDFSQIVANANAPAFPPFPAEDLYDAAYEAAADTVFPDEE